MFVGGAVLALASSAPLAGARVTARTEPPPEARTLSRAFANVARAVGPSVVRIEVTGPSEQATASGVILDTHGNVVTSNHALDGGEPQSIAVVLLDGRRFGAAIVGRDPGTDVAVLKMVAPPRDLSAARFGDSDVTDVGEWVLAVGSPLGLEQTITAGIISGRAHVGASDTNPGHVYLQTDAKVNPGNSGGPLVNLEGEAIGLSALISAGPGGSYGYAIPMNRVRRTAAMLLRDGHAQHPYIGVALRDVRDLDPVERVRWGERLPPRGALVSRIMRDAPAARAGLRAGDVITSVNDREIPAATELADLVATQEVGARLVVGFIRGGAARRVPLSVADLPVRGPDSADGL